MLRMRRLAAAGLLLLATCACVRSQATSVCDSACQSGQAAALGEFYSSTNGPTWVAPNALTVRGLGGTPWLSTATNARDPSLPPFCSWQGAHLYLRVLGWASTRTLTCREGCLQASCAARTTAPWTCPASPARASRLPAQLWPVRAREVSQGCTCRTGLLGGISAGTHKGCEV